MKKIVLFLICFIYGVVHQTNVLPVNTHPGNEYGIGKNLKYRFEYTVEGTTSGVFLLFFRYRFFFFANASVLLNAGKIDEKTMLFNFADIDKTGYVIRTWGYSGKTLITGAADYDLKKAGEILDKGFSIFEEKIPDFSRINVHQEVFPFKILSRGKNVMSFKREINGVHRNCSINMELKKIKPDTKYNFYFNIYPIIAEMLKIYNHPFFPGNWKEISQLKPGREWQSPLLDLSDNINRIGSLAVDIIKKHVTFKQTRPFRMTYCVVSRTPDKLTIQGKAVPQVKIWNGYKLVQVTRLVVLRLPGGIVLEDKLHTKISKRKGKCGDVSCALILLR